MNDEVVNNDLSDEQVDALLNEEKSTDIPMEASKQAAPTPQEYTLKVRDKEIKAPLDKVLQWAQMGYDYPQKAAELNQQQEQWKQQAQEKEKYWSEIEQKWKPFKEVDEYAAKNPDWWNHVQEQYKAKAMSAESNPELQQIKQEIAEMKQFKNEQMAQEQSKKTEQEDNALKADIESLRKTYSSVDFDAPDESGNSLENRVLKHAVDNDIKSFKVAFRDYYHDHLVNKAKEEGKEIVSKNIQKQTKLGILGESPKPTTGLKVAANVKGKSYNDLVQEALAEINGG